MKANLKVKTYDVTLFGDVCGIVADFSLSAYSLTDLKGLISMYIRHYNYTGIGQVMVYDAFGNKLYIAPSVKMNFRLS